MRLDPLGPARFVARTGVEAFDAVIERAVDHMLADGELERIVDRVLASPALDRIADRIVESPSAERLVARVIESRLMDEAVARLLDSDDLWLLVDEIARSPSVTEAIAHQSAGMADEVGEVVRKSTRSADDRLERIARRLVRRQAARSAATPTPRPEL